MSGRVVGLALGGGGLRGLAHIGVLQVLAAEGMQVDLVAGTSSGAMVAALWASGWEPAGMEALSRTVSRSDIYDPAIGWRDLVRLGLELSASFYGLRWRRKNVPPSGLLRGDKLERLLHRWTGGIRLADLTRPLAVVATDLRTHQPVVFSSPSLAGRLAEELPDSVVITEATVAEACRASTAVPGVFAPKRLLDRLLVDGGISDNVPAGVLKAMGADLVVAVDLGLRGRPESLAMWEVLAASMDLMTVARVRGQLESHADHVIQPRVPDVSLMDLERAGEVIESGQQAVIAALPVLRRLWIGTEPPVLRSADLSHAAW